MISVDNNMKTNIYKKLKEEKDPLKQAEISMEIMKIRGGSRNGIRN